MFDMHWRRSFGLVKNPKLKTLAKNELNPELRRWLQHDLKEERINKQRRLDYLHTLRNRLKAAVS